MRIVLVLPLFAVACGRTPVFEGPELAVQVVDEAGNGVRRADVDLRGEDDDGARVVDRARTDGSGIAVFGHPGAGRYQLRVHTDLTCCVHEGALEARLRASDELVVVETVTGPCPTVAPTWCDN